MTNRHAQIALASLLLALAVIFAPSAAAGWRPMVLVHTVAAHIDPDRDYRTATPGLGVGATNGDWAVAVGSYLNSDDLQSWYAATNRSWSVWHTGAWRLRAGVMGGIVYGYPTSPLPILGGTITVWHRDLGIGLLAVPPSAASSSAIQLIVRIKF